MKARVCHVFPTFGPGGSQARTVRLIEAIGPDLQHTILSLSGDLRCADRLVGTPGLRARALSRHELGRVPVAGLARILRQEAADLVLTYNWGAIEAVVAGRVAGLPVIHHEDGFNPDEIAGQKRRRVLARRLVLRGAHAVIVPSVTLDRIARTRWRLPDELVAMIPNGVDLQRFCPGDDDEIRHRLGLGPADLLVGTVGHLNPGKNIAMLVRAVAAAVSTVPAHLLIIGEGGERARLDRLIRSLSLEPLVHFAGHVPDPAAHLRALDVFAMASRTEQMPIAVLEAMASGLPVLGTDVGDVRAMVAPDNRAIVLPPDDEAGYARALTRLLESGPMRSALGAANRARCEDRYDESRMIERHAAIWAEALAARRGDGSAAQAASSSAASRSISRRGSVSVASRRRSRYR